MSTVCIGKTLKGKACKKLTRHESGYCGYHIDQFQENKGENDIDLGDIDLGDIKSPKSPRSPKSPKRKISKPKSKVNDNKEYKNLITQIKKKIKENEKTLKPLRKQVTLNYRKLGIISQFIDLMGEIQQNVPELLIDQKQYIASMDLEEKFEDLHASLSDQLNEKQRSFQFVSKLLKKEILNKKVITKGKFVSSSEEKFECPICLCDGDESVLLPCGHGYHGDCIAEYFCKDGRTCPICKVAVA